MTLVMEELDIAGYEKVVKIIDKSVALHAIVAIHSTALGPSLGGVRMYPYSAFEDALTDVLRLSKGMTLKSALAECGTGGGKSVIIGDPSIQKTDALFESFGRAVDKLRGMYIAAEDVGITPEDVSLIHNTTKYVVGLHKENSSGNPAPYTAWGTYRGIQSALNKVFGSPSVRGRTIAIQGLGAVGWRLAEFLFWEGAKLVVADVNSERVKQAKVRFAATDVSVAEIHKVPCDVFSPCALGSVITDETIPELQCRIVAGCANNQLAEEKHARILKDRAVLYVPDFVVNAGGLINVSVELEQTGYNPASARDKVDNIYDQLETIFDISDKSEVSTHEAALSLAEYRLTYQIGKRKEELSFDYIGMDV